MVEVILDKNSSAFSTAGGPSDTPRERLIALAIDTAELGSND
jgi:hypothetical protein